MKAIHTLSAEDTRRVEVAYRFPAVPDVAEAVVDCIKGVATVYYVQYLSTLGQLAAPASSTSSPSVSALSCSHLDEHLSVQLQHLAMRVESALTVHTSMSSCVVDTAEAPRVATVDVGVRDALADPLVLPRWLDVSLLASLSHLAEAMTLHVALHRHVIPSGDTAQDEAGESGGMLAASSPQDELSRTTLLALQWHHGVAQSHVVVSSLPLAWIRSAFADAMPSTVVCPPADIAEARYRVKASPVCASFRIVVVCEVDGVFDKIPVRRIPFCGVRSPEKDQLVSSRSVVSRTHVQARATAQRRLRRLGFQQAAATTVAPHYLADSVSSIETDTPARFSLALNRPMRHGDDAVSAESLRPGLEEEIISCTSRPAHLVTPGVHSVGAPTTDGEQLGGGLLQAFFPSWLPSRTPASSPWATRCLHEVVVVPGGFAVLFWSRSFLQNALAVTRVGPVRRNRGSSADELSSAPPTTPAPVMILSRVPDDVLQSAATRSTPPSSHVVAPCVRSSSAFCYAVAETHEAYQAVQRYFSATPFLIFVAPDILDSGARRHRHDREEGVLNDFESCFAEAVARFLGERRPGQQQQQHPRHSPSLRAQDDEEEKKGETHRSADVALMVAGASVTAQPLHDHIVVPVVTVVARMCRGPLTQRHLSPPPQPLSYPTRTMTMTDTQSTVRFAYLLRALGKAQSGVHLSHDAAAVPGMSALSASRAAAMALARASTHGAVGRASPGYAYAASHPRRTPVVLSGGQGGVKAPAVAPPLALTGKSEVDLGVLRRVLHSAATHTHAPSPSMPLPNTAARDGEAKATASSACPCGGGGSVEDADVAAVDEELLQARPAAWAENWYGLIPTGFAAPRAWLPSFSLTLEKPASAVADDAQRGVDVCPLVQPKRLAASAVFQWAQKFLVVAVPALPPSTSAACQVTQRESALDDDFSRALGQGHGPQTCFFGASLAPGPSLSQMKHRVEWWLVDQHAAHERVRLEWFLTFAEAYVCHPELDAHAEDTPCRGGAETGAALAHRITRVRHLVAELAAQPCSRTPRRLHSPPVDLWVALPADLISAITQLERVLLTWGWRFAHEQTATSGAAAARCVAVSHWPCITVEGIELTLQTLQDLRWVVEELSQVHGSCAEATGVDTPIVEAAARGLAPLGPVVPSAVLQFFISRSCRGAVKFGDPLSPSAARTLVEAMATATQFYVCSHGRPCLCRLTPLRNF